MAVTTGVGARWGDRLNPLVVKEVRQGLRSRVFWVSFGLLLLVCFLISLGAWASTREDALSPHGPAFFQSFCFCLGLVHGFLLPYGAYRSLAREREDETWVLLILTGLGPRRILRGKVGSCLVQGGLYASVMGPFVLFSYYLNGLELPVILLVMALGVCWFLFLTVVAVCAASLAEGRMGRGLVHMALLGGLGLGLLFSQALVLGLSAQSLSVLVYGRDERTFFLGGLWVMLTTSWVLFETAAARLSLLTENYSRAPRRALLVQVGLSLLLVLGWWWVEPDLERMLSLGMMGTFYLALCGLLLATDMEGQARSLRAATRPWSLLRPGALRGFRLAVVLLLAWSAGCALALFIPSGLAASPFSLGALCLPLYALLYLSLPVWLARGLARVSRSDAFFSPAVVRLLFVLLVCLGTLLPLLANAILGLDTDGSPLTLLNPFLGAESFLYARGALDTPVLLHGMLVCLALLAALSAFLADRALAAGERRAHAS